MDAYNKFASTFIAGILPDLLARAHPHFRKGRVEGRRGVLSGFDVKFWELVAEEVLRTGDESLLTLFLRCTW